MAFIALVNTVVYRSGKILSGYVRRLMIEICFLRLGVLRRSNFEGWDLHLNPPRGTKDALDEEQVDYWKKSTSGLIPAHNFTTGQGSRMIEQYNAHLHM
jgi:hypothetical protein